MSEPNTAPVKEQEKKLNKRYFDVVGAALHMSDIVPNGVIDRCLEEANIVVQDQSSIAERTVHYLKTCGITAQGGFAAVFINLTHGENRPITGEELTRAIATAFPNAGVDKRHGPHYLSYARTGKFNKLPGLREDLPPIPTSRRKRSKKEQEVPVADGDQPLFTAEMLMSENDRRTLQEISKGMGVSAGGKTEAIAQRIADFMNGVSNTESSEEVQKEEAA
jgi:hypothetical protein